jgi:hypothetical protein
MILVGWARLPIALRASQRHAGAVSLHTGRRQNGLTIQITQLWLNIQSIISDWVNSSYVSSSYPSKVWSTFPFFNNLVGISPLTDFQHFEQILSNIVKSDPLIERNPRFWSSAGLYARLRRIHQIRPCCRHPR